MSAPAQLDPHCGEAIVQALAAAISAARQHLSEIDAAIGDGDHGINMSKGFAQGLRRVRDADVQDIGAALAQLSAALLDDIGGSMGPLYGVFFLHLGEALGGPAAIDAARFGRALRAASEAVQALGGARPGDKTLVDVLVPAEQAYAALLAANAGFAAALAGMADAAHAGCAATAAMQARLGRAARLGSRSIGVPDAGAASCALILGVLAEQITLRLS